MLSNSILHFTRSLPGTSCRLLIKSRSLYYQPFNIYNWHKTYQFGTIKPKQKKDVDILLSHAKVVQQQQNQINNPNLRLKREEEKTRQTNLKVLKRELFCDSVQLPIKFLAFSLAGQNAGTFLAEFIRASIDCINHLIMFGSTFLNVDPSKKFPYGMENIKNVVVMIPAMLFLVFGCETIYSAFMEMYQTVGNVATENEGSDLKSLLIFFVSLGVEIGVISYNLIDNYKMNNKSDQKVSFATILKSLFSKKDPLLQAILYENAISLTSMSVPVTCSILSMIYPTHIFSFIGQNVIGLIQLYCAFQLGHENVKQLLGEGVDEVIVNDIVSIIKSNPYVKDVKQEKAVMIGHIKFRVFAEITYDIDKLNDMIKQEYLHTLESIIYSTSYDQREDKLKELMMQLPNRLFKEIQRQKDLIEQAIQEKYPQCLHIDIEMQQQTLLKIIEKEEKTRTIWTEQWQNQFLWQDSKATDELAIFNSKWIKTEVDYFINKDFSKYKKIQKEQQKAKNSNIKKFPHHYKMDLSQKYTEENKIVNEQQRRAIIQYQYNEEVSWTQTENPFKFLDEEK